MFELAQTVSACKAGYASTSYVPFATESELDLLVLGVAGVVRGRVVGGHGCEEEMGAVVGSRDLNM